MGVTGWGSVRTQVGPNNDEYHYRAAKSVCAHHHEFLMRNLTVAIEVKVDEGRLEVVLTLQLALVDRRGKELLIINRPVTVNVSILSWV